MKGEPQRFAVGHHAVLRGAQSPAWSGGRADSGEGYVLIYAPDHPRAQRGYVREHVLVVENALGHYLPATAKVHHVDGNRANNAPTNLVVCADNGYHALLHQRQRALDATGDPNALRCYICHQYDLRERLYIRPNGRKGFHRACQAEYARKRFRARRAA